MTAALADDLRGCTRRPGNSELNRRNTSARRSRIERAAADGLPNCAHVSTTQIMKSLGVCPRRGSVQPEYELCAREGGLVVLAVVGVEAYVVRTRALFFPLSGMDGDMRGPLRAHPGSAVATASGRTARLDCPGTTPSATRGWFATRGGVWREKLRAPNRQLRLRLTKAANHRSHCVWKFPLVMPWSRSRRGTLPAGPSPNPPRTTTRSALHGACSCEARSHTGSAH